MKRKTKRILVVVVKWRHRANGLLETGKKKHTANWVITQAYQSRCSCWRPSSFKGQNHVSLLNPLTHQASWKTKTMPYEIGLPMILTSGLFLSYKPNKQTIYELQKNLDGSCISFCISRGKRQLKHNKMAIQNSVSFSYQKTRLQMLHKFSAWTHLSNFDQSEHKNWTKSVTDAYPWWE